MSSLEVFKTKKELNFSYLRNKAMKVNVTSKSSHALYRDRKKRERERERERRK
jgi:hypothetical protein